MPNPTDPPEQSESRGGLPLAREHLFAARTVLLFGEITTASAETTVAQLLALTERSSDPIRVVLHSQGGHVEAADTIFDVIRSVRPTVRILGTGWVASAGALIYAAAKRDNRFALPNTRFMLHQPLGGVKGQATDVEIEARQVLAMRARINAILAEATGHPLEKIAKDTERNHWMNAEQAVSYGLVGAIVRDSAVFSSIGQNSPPQ